MHHARKCSAAVPLGMLLSSPSGVTATETTAPSTSAANGSLGLVALHRASMHHDQPRMDTILAQLAQSANSDLHFMSPWQRFLVAMKRLPPPSGAPGASADSLRQEQAIALAMAFALQSMQSLVDACKPGSPTIDARRKPCSALVNSLRRSDSLIANMIGLRLQQWTARDAAGRRMTRWRDAVACNGK